MTLLINRAEIAKFKQISKTANNDVLNMHIREAQENDLKPLMGERLYLTVLTNLTDPNYLLLLNGGTYSHNGIDYHVEGIRKVLVYYSFARYVMFGDAIDTPFSMVQKLNGNESKPVDASFKKSNWQINKDMAYNSWLSVDAYLRRTNNTLYLSHCGRKVSGRINFTKIV